MARVKSTRKFPTTRTGAIPRFQNKPGMSFQYAGEKFAASKGEMHRGMLKNKMPAMKSVGTLGRMKKMMSKKMK